jgi:prefoldin subunit 5|tara:strand:- start:1470 stop:1658 length:189 start_codon:yes stop_codon:yes gene_type:complete
MEIITYVLIGVVVILTLAIINLYLKFNALDEYIDEMDNAINEIDSMYMKLQKLLTERLQTFN